MEQLTTLHCSNNRLTDPAPLATLKELTILGCAGNQLTDLALLAPLSLDGKDFVALAVLEQARQNGKAAGDFPCTRHCGGATLSWVPPVTGA
ncbi:MAG TPA: leucine-rich repeat domain-containing protein [Nitrospirales bacterium]|nr:leucine-rich repeat domain-containing protein [Nitrospirales bacterium]